MTFTVTDGVYAIVGASVAIVSQDTIATDVYGRAIFDLADGTYAYDVTAAGYDAITDRSVTVAGAAVPVTVIMTAATFTLTYTAGTNGTITGTSPQTVNYGSDGTLVTAVPDAGYNFVSWSDGIDTAARTDINVTANISVTATFVKRPLITEVHIQSNNADITKAMNGDIITLTFTADEAVTKLGNFKINGSNPDTFTNVGLVYTATHLVDSGDPITGDPATFQINVMNAAGIYSTTVEATTDGSSVTIIPVTP